MILTQTKAMFVDAFRELHARKLFWITVGLSGLVIILLSLTGYEQGVGISYAFWDFGGSESFATQSKESFYRSLVIDFGITIWLTWIATIIAIISTAAIIPTMVTDGAIDTVLSKPIGRVRLFLTKYLTGLLFVAAQVTVFTVGSIIMLGIRAGVWEPRLLLAIPIVVLFFSYLYCLSALIGMLTRSSLSALLVTGLFWGTLILLNRADDTFGNLKHMSAFQIETAQAELDYYPSRIAELQASIDAAKAEGLKASSADTRDINRFNQRVEEAQGVIDQFQGMNKFTTPAHRYTLMSRAILPKTSETIRLLNRWLIDKEEIEVMANAQFEEEFGDSDAVDPDKVKPLFLRIEEEQRSRSLWWILGTSLIFEGVILGICCLIFARRDF